MLLALSRNVPQGTAALRAGRWEKKALQGHEICGKVLGVVGFGKIGSIVADRARGLRIEGLLRRLVDLLQRQLRSSLRDRIGNGESGLKPFASQNAAA